MSDSGLLHCLSHPWRAGGGLVLLGLVACCGCGPAEIDVADAPTIRFAGDPYGDTDAIEVTGLSPSSLASLDELTTEQWVDALAVLTEAAADDPGAPVVLGDYRIDAGRVLFTPRFPFAPGMSYLARFAPPSGIEPIEWTFSIPEVTGASTTRVAEIFPSAATWPMNQLKMYVHFSGPMRTGRAFDFIRLIDEDTGIEVEQPFVTVQEELWDQTHETLTILYDPGRIKRGLVPNQEAGLPLQTGRSYRLVIDAGWPDTDGRLLEEPYEHHFSIGEIDRTSPHPNGWILTVPGAETRDPLVLAFGEPLDHGLLHTLIGVRRAATGTKTSRWATTTETTPADQLLGRVETTDAESAWRFFPDELWAAGRYEVVIPTILEDLAGNNLKNLFDVDLGEVPSEFGGVEAVYLPFVVAGR